MTETAGGVVLLLGCLIAAGNLTIRYRTVPLLGEVMAGLGISVVIVMRDLRKGGPGGRL
jgi:hypothetical protein